MRIALSGSAGTGKTTLGKQLALDLGLPYVEEGMRTLLERGLDMHSLDIEQQRQLIRDMWERQASQEDAASSGVVADRSSLDYAAFWMHYSLHEDVDATEAFLGQMIEHATSYDLVVLLPWGVIPLEADGVRSTNRFVQLRYQGILEGCLRRFLPAAKLLQVPETSSLEERRRFVLSALQ